MVAKAVGQTIQGQMRNSWLVSVSHCMLEPRLDKAAALKPYQLPQPLLLAPPCSNPPKVGKIDHCSLAAEQPSSSRRTFTRRHQAAGACCPLLSSTATAAVGEVCWLLNIPHALAVTGLCLKVMDTLRSSSRSAFLTACMQKSAGQHMLGTDAPVIKLSKSPNAETSWVMHCHRPHALAVTGLCLKVMDTLRSSSKSAFAMACVKL